jgi:hypothetical protein
MTTAPQEQVISMQVDGVWFRTRTSDIPDWREDDGLLVKCLKVERHYYRKRHEELVEELCHGRDALLSDVIRNSGYASSANSS